MRYEATPMAMEGDAPGGCARSTTEGILQAQGEGDVARGEGVRAVAEVEINLRCGGVYKWENAMVHYINIPSDISKKYNFGSTGTMYFRNVQVLWKLHE
jgi:hypothetical protein